jgi:transposase-like protein
LICRRNRLYVMAMLDTICDQVCEEGVVVKKAVYIAIETDL